MAALVPGGAAAAGGAQREAAEELRREVERMAPTLGIDASYRIVSGDPFGELVRTAESEHAEALVVGASESAGHRLFGSLAVRLLRTGRWPVTVVP